MRKNRVIEQNRCYHLVSRLAHRAFFLDEEEKDRAVALMRRVEAGVQAIMSYCINRTISISSDPLLPLRFDRQRVAGRPGIYARTSPVGITSGGCALPARGGSFFGGRLKPIANGRHGTAKPRRGGHL